jgi:hypothetical protein
VTTAPYTPPRESADLRLLRRLVRQGVMKRHGTQPAAIRWRQLAEQDPTVRPKRKRR